PLEEISVMPPASTLAVRMLPLAQLRPAPYNPRQRLKPADPAYQKLTASLRAFGLVEPLVWNETTGYVVGGHARLAILQALGVTEVAVSVVRLRPAQEKALNLVLNNREAQGRFDPDRLAELLVELRELPEFALSGFDADDLEALRLEPDPEAAPERETDSERVEITLVTDTTTHTKVAPRLDALVREFDLVRHVQKGAR